MPTPEEFRRAWGKFPTGVSVITTRMEDGTPYCTTANAVASVSLDPMLVQLNLGKASVTCSNVLRDKRFGINMLRADHEAIARAFAVGAPEDRQRDPEWTSCTEDGTVLFDDAITVMACHVVQEVSAGDHVIFIAEVERLEVRDGQPLVFHEGAYKGLD